MEKDYIKREAVIDILNAKADMALGTPKQVFLSVAKMVELLPTADVVEVVRCKDCKNLIFLNDGSPECSRVYLGNVHANDYCSYGERKEQ